MTGLPPQTNPPTEPLTTPNSLPTSRALLTSLLTAISTIPLTSPANQTTAEGVISFLPQEKEQSNPLRRVPPSHRHLIVTLHVFFPGLVLPALDLLERGFVARVSLCNADSNHYPKIIDSDGGGSGDAVGVVGLSVGGGDAGLDATGEQIRVGVGAGIHGDVGEGNHRDAAATAHKEETSNKTPAFYLVQSAAAASAALEKRRRRKQQHRDESGDDGDGTGTVVNQGNKGGYIVRLDAWHCSCAAFAFAAVQGEHATGCHGWEGGGGEMGVGDAVGETGMKWSFGGMSLDGLAAGAGEAVPVCKHLLACLLAERWSAALGRYVVERRVGREEMAGIVADV